MYYQRLKHTLQARPRTWVVTGVAGFIGSNILETLLQLEQNVVGLDNFSTGYHHNLEQVEQAVGFKQWSNARIVEGDIRDLPTCQRACAGADFVLHQAALASVPRSLADPVRTHESNVTGFLNMLVAARDADVKRFVFASSSSVYGNHPALPQHEENIGQPLSPYAATKSMNETYAGVFARAFGLACIGLRYFNVFGPRQEPNGAYASVIPRWIASLLQGRSIHIFGDGETSRDFSFVDNVVQANLLAATAENSAALNQVFNVAVGDRTTLNQLFEMIQNTLRELDPSVPEQQPVYQDARPGDVRHSQAGIGKAQELLGYVPTHNVEQGLEKAMGWYRDRLKPVLQRRAVEEPVGAL